MEKLKAIVVASETESRITAKHLLQHECFSISAYVESNADSYLKINGIYPDVVLCIDEGNQIVFDLAKRIYVSMPGVLLVLASSDSAILAHNSVESGFHLYVPEAQNPHEFGELALKMTAMEKKRLTDTQKRNTNAKVISVYGAKGGCGKTVVATNLAVQFAKEKKKTLLIDASFHFGDVCLYLDLNPKDTVSEYVEESDANNPEVINSFTTLHNSGLNVLPAARTPESAEYITEEHLEKLISLVRPQYECIIIDLPVSLNNTTVTAIENSDTVLYVLTPEIAALKNMYQVKRIMESLQQYPKFSLVLNRAGTGTLSPGEIKKNSAFPLVGVLSEDAKFIPQSLGQGVPVVMMPKKTRFAGEIEQLYDKLNGI